VTPPASDLARLGGQIARRHDSRDRPHVDDPEVRRLIAAIAPGAEATDLGGTMSLNLWLRPAGMVLRVHRPLLSADRLGALQRVRDHLAARGLNVGAPVAWRGRTLFPCGGRWAEMEPYLPSTRPDPTGEAYGEMLRAAGSLHRALATYPGKVPRPLVATYGPPTTLLRWLPVAETAAAEDAAAREILSQVRGAIGLLRRRWVPETALPRGLIHGDIRLANVPRAPSGEPVYFDFGFLAHRPRIHELAYALAWIVLRPDGRGRAEEFAWENFPDLLRAYEEGSDVRLTDLERRALGPYLAAVPLFLMALAGYVPDPVGHLRSEARLAFLRIGEWVLRHPEAAR